MRLSRGPASRTAGARETIEREPTATGGSPPGGSKSIGVVRWGAPVRLAVVSVGSSSPGSAPKTTWVPVVSPTTFRRLAIASLVAVCLIVLTGAAVRLTGSGLGCPDWPSCYRSQVTPQLSFHPLVEFSNRLVTVVLTVLIAVTFLAALRRRPLRSDLAHGGAPGWSIRPSGDRCDRRLHEAQSLRRPGALLGVDGARGSGDGARAPEQPRLRA